MQQGLEKAIAVVGLGAILPDAPDVDTFWKNITGGRYSVSDVSPDRWDPALYYDPDPRAPDKSYSKIGGWVREYTWDPGKWRLPIPPRVANAMDDAQKWAIACTRDALLDYGYPARTFDLDRTAVILGNAMSGEKHYLTALRLYFPEYERELEATEAFASLPAGVRSDIRRELHKRVASHLPEITEDSMPGELANCIAGRIANLFNLHGPNFVVDAACASAMAAFTAATEGLVENEFDVAITGGIDRNMGASTFIKFCKIGALSATGTRPYAEGADGFVMGEGAAIFLLKRLADAERDKDKIYALIRGISGSSDGKGKGITAPNPVGQKLCIERAWKNAGLCPSAATMIEGHGTSTRVGDVVEVQSFAEVLNQTAPAPKSIALGSVKSNFGHLKGAAGAAGLLKTVLSLHHKTLPPSIHCERTNPDIDFAHSPLYVNTVLKPWEVADGSTRLAGVSAFGFGGTNFHAVLEEYVPQRTNWNGKKSVAVSEFTQAAKGSAAPARLSCTERKVPLRGALVVGGQTGAEVLEKLGLVQKQAAAGAAPRPAAPKPEDLRAPERIVIDFGSAAELCEKCSRTRKALESDQAPVWKALRAQGIFRGRGPAPKVAFLYPGQGSQYINMLRALRDRESIIEDTFREADEVMLPLLGKALSEFIFIDQNNASEVERAEQALRQTAITQPAVLACDIAITRLLAAYGITPDMTMGHSLGEYGALVASGVMSFKDALEGVSARGREMTRVAVQDNGHMAAVFAPLKEIERILASAQGYVVIANINSNSQAVIGGASDAVDRAVEAFLREGFNAVPLPVSHAFHTSIVAPASEPLRQMLRRIELQSPRVPVVANVSGEFYPMGDGIREQVIQILGEQIASPVQFVKGLRTLYEAGARVFVEVGPKKALQGFADDVLGADPTILSLFTNHPKFADDVAFNQALCGMYAAGLGGEMSQPSARQEGAQEFAIPSLSSTPHNQEQESVAMRPITDGNYDELGRYFAEVLQRGWSIYKPKSEKQVAPPVVITGAALGLPGTPSIFSDDNIVRLLRGERFIQPVPEALRKAMLDKHITRLVKSDNGGPVFETINTVGEVIKLAGRGGKFDLEEEFGISSDRVPALDRATALAIAAGIDALRDAGIPMLMRYKTTTRGTQLPDRWALPECMRDDTGVIFASAFPGLNSFAEETSRYYTDRSRREQLAMLQEFATTANANGHSPLTQAIADRIARLQSDLQKEPYVFERRFLLRTLSMGHSQFAELIGARGPNTQLNAACASTTQALSVAEDWITNGRCRRVVIISADDVTSDSMMEWFGAGFLSSGAAATDDSVEDAAIPFDRRRHGLIVGMGAAALVVESPEAARERGIQPICELLSAVTANSAYHGTRLDVDHIRQVMESLLRRAESQCGISRSAIASRTVFVSHETYTPARGGSASAEVHSLRSVFGEATGEIVIANTKGYTGHAMATGIEDVLAVKCLETGIVPAVANFKEVDPELGPLNLSRGGSYPIDFALRLGAGFGSQISMALLRWIPTPDGSKCASDKLGYAYRITDTHTWNSWLAKVSNKATPKVVVEHRNLRVLDEAPAATATGKAEITPVQQSPATPTEHVEVNASVITGGEDVKSRVLSLVVEKTGYPLEMLDLDLDMEADLGVDTVKQAELFAAVREIYNIPRDPNLKLRDFPTLAHVIRFVEERRGDQRAVIPAETHQAPVETSVASPPIEDSVQDRILSLVVEKTGYPKEMLDLDLDLEADLGIDTVKQAELFASMRQIYGIERDANLKLRDFPTLKHVIEFVYSKRQDLRPSAQQTAAPSHAISDIVPAEPPTEISPAPETIDPEQIARTVLNIAAEKTGYPTEMLALDLDLEADLGIDTVKQAEMFASVRQAFKIPRADDLKLRDFPTLGHVIEFAKSRSRASTNSPDDLSTVTVRSQFPVADFEKANRIPRRLPVLSLRPAVTNCERSAVKLNASSRVVVMPDKSGVADVLESLLRARGVTVLRLPHDSDPECMLHEWSRQGPIQGVYWLPALDEHPAVTAMTADNWKQAVQVRVKYLYSCMRSLYEYVQQNHTFLVTATALGGQHGYEAEGATAPIGGAVTGFAKAYKRERPEALVKAVDVELGRPVAEIANTLLNETLSDPSAVEVGHKAGARWSIEMQEQPSEAIAKGITPNKETVFVVTGAAGSIVSAITVDLARASGGTFYLLDLVPEPDPSNPDFERLTSDKDALKRDMFQRLQSRGERATPALVEKELANLERGRAALQAIQAIQGAGGKAHYISLDLRNGDAVAQIIERVREEQGRIDVLIHAAGMERSHLLADKPASEFDLVFDVKSDGFFHLLHAIGDMPLGATVAFSSIAGRFGNAGQTDYSSANDLLCKLMSSLKRTHPLTQAIAIDWSAWKDIGMASRGSIPKMMELAGIDMLDPEAAIPIVRRELTSGFRGEVVIANRLGILLPGPDGPGGETKRISVPDQAKVVGPMVGNIVAVSDSEYQVQAVLDPQAQPFLRDHQINGTPVLPGVMGIEAFAEAALSAGSGWRIDSLRDIKFTAPFKFYRHQPRQISVTVRLRTEADRLVADCSLTGARILAGQSESQVTTHFVGTVSLSNGPTSAKPLIRPTVSVIEPTVDARQIYQIYFHGPAYQVLARAWRDGEHMIGEMSRELPPNHLPEEMETVLDPRVFELCLQTAGLWEITVRSRLGLPQQIEAINFFGRVKRNQAVFAVVTPDERRGTFDVEVIDSSGNLYCQVLGYRTVALTNDVDTSALRWLQAAAA